MKNSCGAAMLVIPVIFFLTIVAPRAKCEVVQNLSVPEYMEVFVPCANGGDGELVVLNGQMHMFLSATANGNMNRYKIQAQPQGMSGFGVVTGDKYHATGGTRSQYFEAMSGQPLRETVVNNYRIIGQGSGNNFLVHEVFHVVIDENGEMVVAVDKAAVECK